MIYHICSRSRWEDGKASGAYEADTLAPEAFMHASTLEQVMDVAHAVFTGQTDLVFLEIDETRLIHDLKYETASNGQDYPHLYGPMNPDAVLRVFDFPPDADGRFTLPDLQVS